MRASHILFKTGEGKDAAAAKSRLKTCSKIKKGENFEALAKEVPETWVHRGEGGDLDFLSARRDDQGPRVRQAAFEMNRRRSQELVKSERHLHHQGHRQASAAKEAAKRGLRAQIRGTVEV